MADATKIEWSDATWNPITGCSVVSPGCTNCYAMRLAGGRLRHHPSRKGLTQSSKAGPVWNGEVRLNEQWLDQPLRWRRPRRIFVCAHGDLFHEAAPDEWVDRVFATMAVARQHQFQVLTKRPARMLSYLAGKMVSARVACEISGLTYSRPGCADHLPALIARLLPLPNVWLGVSVEDQERANERIPILLDTSAAVRFVSAEPLLAEVDLRAIRVPGGHHAKPPLYWDPGMPLGTFDALRSGLHWVIAGGESGPGARPMHPDWARSLRDQCVDAGVPFFFKQWGEWEGPLYPGPEIPDKKRVRLRENHGKPLPSNSGLCIVRVGKKRAGRTLDGRTWDEYPA